MIEVEAMNSITNAATLTEDEIRAALRDCYDPEVPCNIVDLGLVYGIAVELDRDAPGAGIPGVPARHRVSISLTLTTPGCPAHTQIIAQIENRLAAFETVSKTEVELVWQPAWTPQRISPEGRKRLGLDENGSPIVGEGGLGRRVGFPAKKDKLVQLR
jgi:metal-sulfur cluster biosynthetic enzyme